MLEPQRSPAPQCAPPPLSRRAIVARAPCPPPPAVRNSLTRAFDAAATASRACASRTRWPPHWAALDSASSPSPHPTDLI